MIEINIVSHRIKLIERELEYHLGVLGAARDGLIDALNNLTVDEDGAILDEDNEHLANWSHRIGMASRSVTEILRGFRTEAAHLHEIVTTDPPPASECN